MYPTQLKFVYSKWQLLKQLTAYWLVCVIVECFQEVWLDTKQKKIKVTEAFYALIGT